MGPGEIAFDSNGSLKLIYRFGQETCFAIGSPKDDMQLRMIAELFKHAFVDLLRGRELMLLETGESQGVGDVVIVRRYFQRRLSLARRLIKIADHEITLTQHLVR